MASHPQTEPDPEKPSRTMTCPACGVRLSVDLPETDVIVVCPKCFTEFMPMAEDEPARPSAFKQRPRRRGALKRDVSGPEPAPEQVKATAADTSTEKAEGLDSAAKRRERPIRPSHMPSPELVEPSGLQEGVPMEHYHRKEASSGLVKIMLLAVALVGGSALVWILLYQVQLKERQEAAKAPSSRPTNAAGPLAYTSTKAAPVAAPEPKEASKPTPAETKTKDAPEVEAAPKLSPTQMETYEAADAAAQALSAPTWQELLGHVRASAAVLPLMRDYYAARGPFRPERATGIISANLGTTEEGRHLAYISLQMQDYREQRVILERNEEGKYLADWESLVGYQPVSWDDFIRTKPHTASDFRVGVELLQEAPSQVHPLPGVLEPLDNYFPFGLKAGFQGEPTLAYMKNTAPGAADFYARLQTGERFDAILKLHFSDIEGVGEILEITDLVQYGWMKGYGAAAPDAGPVKIEKKPF